MTETACAPGYVLTEQEVADLKWMRICNEDGRGYLSPTVRKNFGSIPELDGLMKQGLARLDDGYWITVAGYAALKEPTHG